MSEDRDSQNEGASQSSGKAAQPKQAAIGSNFKEQRLGQIADRALIVRLWKYMRPYRWTFLVCLLLLPTLSGISLVQPYLLQVAIDRYLVPRKLNGLLVLVAIYAGTLLAQSVTQFFQFYLMQWAGLRSLRDLRQEVFDHVQGLAVSYFHKIPVGRLMTRMTTDIEALQEAISSGTVTMIGDFFTLGAIVAILLYKDWRLALVSFTVMPFLVVLTSIFRHFLRKAFREVRIKIARLYAHLQESITGMAVIQLFVREKVSASEYEAINRDYRDANITSIRFDAMLYSIVEAVGSITVGAIIWYGSGQVLHNIVTIGALVAFIEYMQKFFVPIRDLAQKYNVLQSAMAASERIFQLLDIDERLEATEDPVAMTDGPLTIEFRNVWFAYNDADWVLRDVSFRVAPGEKIALVGHTGAGKTTIISLLTRLYDVTRGSILINGVDIREYDLQEYRRKFAVVLQDVFLFQGTIRENLTLGDDTIPQDEVVSAARTVHAEGLIHRYKDGYQHRVAERGSNLSSGEKQLLAFARALIRKPEVLILDEATANVDTDTEALIQDAVEVLMQQQTSVVIAHRLSTIQKADRIIVLHHGEIQETGTHEELLKRGGHYEMLYRLQYAFHDNGRAANAQDSEASEESARTA